MELSYTPFTMSSDPLSAPVLVLNRNWSPIGETTTKQALIDLWGQPASKLPMHVELEWDANEEEWKLGSGTRPVSLEEWLELPVREDHHEDRALHTHKFIFRGPTVVICSVYDDMPQRTMRWSTGNVWIRDEGKCQITGRKLSRAEGNVGHNIARAKGGTDCFSNTLLMDKRLNTLQGTKTFAEMGWKPLKQPKAPPALPIAATIKLARHPQWTPFLL